MADLKETLEEYVTTANNPEYKGDFGIINSKFPELKNYDTKLLEEYVATANNEKYQGDFNVINKKFPEFFDVKKKRRAKLKEWFKRFFFLKYDIEIRIRVFQR